MATKKPAIQAGTAPSAGDADWQRARRPEQKEERRQSILRAAIELLDEAGIEGTTLSEIARQAGLSKANCYRYFESREAILLELTLDEIESWMADIGRRLEPLADSGDIAGVAEAFSAATLERPRLCSLFSTISSVLERNVSADVVAEFKQRFNAQVFGSSDAIQAAIPSLSTENAEKFVLFLGFFIAGAWPSANPAPAVLEAFERSDFAERKLDFPDALRTHSIVVLRGLLADPNT